MKDEVLLKPNPLIRGILEVESNEYKAFNLILHKTQLDIQKNIDTTLIPIVVTLEEFKTIFKKTNKGTLNGIEKTLEKLRKTSIDFIDANNKPTTANLISKLKLNKNHMAIEVYMDAEVVKTLKEFKKVGYTPLDLCLIKKASGFYTQRIYELCRSWSGLKKEFKISLDELKKILKIKDHKSYESFRTFKARVLQSSVDEINENLNMKISYDVIRQGKKATHIVFKIEDLEPRNYKFKNNIDSDGNIPLKGQMHIDNINTQDIFNTMETREYSYFREYSYIIDKQIRKLKDVKITDITQTHIEKFFEKYDSFTVEKAIEKMIDNVIFEDKEYKNPVKELRNLIESNIKNTSVTKEVEENKEEIDNPIINMHIRLISNGITRISLKKLEELEEEHGLKMLQNAINICIENNAKEKIGAPVRYIIGVLKNLEENKIKANTIKNYKTPKTSNFRNFTEREYDYEKLERQLLGWDDSDDDD